jgi:hypothetical protein
MVDLSQFIRDYALKSLEHLLYGHKYLPTPGLKITEMTYIYHFIIKEIKVHINEETYSKYFNIN